MIVGLFLLPLTVGGADILFYCHGAIPLCFKHIFDFTTAGDWDCVAAVERLPALNYSVDFVFSCPLGSWISLWNFETIRGSLMKPKWQKLASLAQEICTL